MCAVYIWAHASPCVRSVCKLVSMNMDIVYSLPLSQYVCAHVYPKSCALRGCPEGRENSLDLVTDILRKYFKINILAFVMATSCLTVANKAS